MRKKLSTGVKTKGKLVNAAVSGRLGINKGLFRKDRRNPFKDRTRGRKR